MYIERAQDDSCETQKQWHRFLHGALSFFFGVGFDQSIECFYGTGIVFLWFAKHDQITTGFKMFFCILGLQGVIL